MSSGNTSKECARSLPAAEDARRSAKNRGRPTSTSMIPLGEHTCSPVLAAGAPPMYDVSASELRLIADKAAIDALIQGWMFRDIGQWDKLRTLFHSDGSMEPFAFLAFARREMGCPNSTTCRARPRCASSPGLRDCSGDGALRPPHAGTALSPGVDVDPVAAHLSTDQ